MCVCVRACVAECALLRSGCIFQRNRNISQSAVHLDQKIIFLYELREGGAWLSETFGIVCVFHVLNVCCICHEEKRFV